MALRLPIRTRLTLVTAALITVVLVAGGALLYLRLRADLVEAVDAGLRSRAQALLGSLQVSDGGVEAGGGLTEGDEAFAQVLGPDGAVVTSSGALVNRPLLDPSEAASVEGPSFLDREVTAGGEIVPARLMAVPASGGRVVVVGASLEDQREALARLGVLLAVGGPLALALITGIGWMVTGAALRPVEAMRREAGEIHASRPGRRLPVPAGGDEMARLAVTLNEMLERLEMALERERRFVADASHELRTPLANLRIELDLALRRSRSAEELEAAVRSATEETERLSRLAEDLLVLARADSGRLPVRLELADVIHVVGSTVDAFTPRAADRGISLETNGPAGLTARVDSLRLGQALGNLLDNALRHTPPDGRVSVGVVREDGFVRIEVSDTGPGFPVAFLPRAFEAFARPDPSRSRPDGGTGLGLAIVRAVAQAHGGTVEAANTPNGGASVVLMLPSGSGT